MFMEELCELLGGKIEGNSCKIEGKKFRKKSEIYELFGFTIVTDWYNNRGWTTLEILTNKEGLEKIKKEPLKDYISFYFNAKSVDYVEFNNIVRENCFAEDSEKHEVGIEVCIKRRENPIITGKFDLKGKDYEEFEKYMKSEGWHNPIKISYML